MFNNFKNIAFLFLIILSGSIVFAQKPVADFTVDMRDGCEYIIVTLTDKSTNNPTSYLWDMGDGTKIPNKPSITYAYSKIGTYTISLTTTNASGSDTKVKKDLIRVHPKPICNFTYTPTNGCKPLSVIFTNNSSSKDTAITSWSWDFGDGNTSTEKAPSHVYKNAGDFKVSLNITDGFTCTGTDAGKIVKVTENPIAAFTSNTHEACTPPIKVDFTNNSTGSNLTYAWDFGNSQTSSNSNPSNNYNTSGSFNVKLIITDGNGCKDTATQDGFVQINTFAVDFTIDKSEACVPAIAYFNYSSADVVTSWDWTFSDGGTSDIKTPGHTFQNVGTYNATLVATNSIGCKATVTKTGVFKGYGQPVINFDASTKVGCKTPFGTTFTDNTPNAVSWQWNTGDGASSTDKTFNHTYDSTKIYAVELIVTDNHGCVDTLKKNNFIRIAGVRADFTANGNIGCKIRKVTLIDSSHTTTSITKYLWTAGSDTSTLKKPVFTFADTGKYDVQLIVSDALGCSDTILKPQYIQVGDKPVTEFDADPEKGCYPLSVKFTSKMLNNTIANRFNWQYGDGQRENAFNPTHIYVDTGHFSVTLKAYHNGCVSDSIYKDSLIYVQPPKAVYNSSIVGCDTIFKPEFINSSQGGNKFIWSFGDGTKDSTYNITDTLFHSYLNSGLYLTELIATDTITKCADTVQGRVHISKRNLDFIQDTTQRNCLYDNIKYKSKSTANNPIVFWNWDFGDGKNDTSSTDSIIHAYDSAGVYNITMVITDSLSCKDTIIKSNDIAIHDLPSFRFSASDTSGCTPFQVTFTIFPKDSLKLKYWDWNFGDGATDSSSWNPTHSFTTPNVDKIIRLHLTDTLLCDSSKTFIITPTFPIINFILQNPRTNGGDSVICYTDTAQFTNQTTGIGLKYTWDFGDGTPIDHNINPKHFFATDSTQFFIVSLTATDTNKCPNTVYKRIIVSHPIAKFGAINTKVDCPFPPPIIDFRDSSSTNVIKRKWDFGDGSSPIYDLLNPQKTFFKPDKYDISLIVQNDFGCSDTLIKPDFIEIEGPSATFTYTPIIGCAPLQVKFKAENTKRVGQFEWIFGDGNSDSTLIDSTTHIYTLDGNPLPFLRIEDSIHKTCKVPVIASIPIHVINGKSVFQLNSEDSTCTYGNIEFFDMSDVFASEPITSRTWYFGDGDSTIASGLLLTHYYDSVGTYPVTLKIITGGCKYDTTISNLLYIFNPPNVDYTWDDTIGCNPLMVHYNVIDSTLIYPVDSLRWDFGNNTFDTVHNPTVSYSNSGLQHIVLDVTYKNKCKQSYAKVANMTVYPLPVADFIVEGDSLFASEVIPFIDQSKTDILQWYWNFGDSVKSTQQNPYHMYALSGTYEVNLLVKSTGNCSDSITKTITITEGIIIPNVFSPNGDGVNDEFRIPISGYTNYHLTIFNRWGEILFDSNVKNASWDGRSPSGRPAPSGTYYFILEATNSSGEDIIHKDFLTLFRD